MHVHICRITSACNDLIYLYVYMRNIFFKKIDLFQLTQKSTPKTVVEFRFFLFTWCPPRSLTLHPSVAVAPRGTRVRLPFREEEDSSKEGEGGEGGAGAVEGPENCQEDKKAINNLN